MKGLSIAGLQRVQKDNLRAIQALKPSGSFGRAILYGSAQAHRYAVANTHVDTGSLKASHRIKMETGLRGRIFIDPSAVNPRSKGKPSEYGVFEHARGGTHGFYQRVIDEQETSIARGAAVILLGGLP
jgi:hypothetical protein